jgi:hypothetical protein
MSPVSSFFNFRPKRSRQVSCPPNAFLVVPNVNVTSTLGITWSTRGAKLQNISPNLDPEGAPTNLRTKANWDTTVRLRDWPLALVGARIPSVYSRITPSSRRTNVLSHLTRRSLMARSDGGAAALKSRAPLQTEVPDKISLSPSLHGPRIASCKHDFPWHSDLKREGWL